VFRVVVYSQLLNGVKCGLDSFDSVHKSRQRLKEAANN
jgi:hypothetical protein